MIFQGIDEHIFRKNLLKDASVPLDVIVLIALYYIDLKLDKFFNGI